MSEADNVAIEEEGRALVQRALQGSGLSNADLVRMGADLLIEYGEHNENIRNALMLIAAAAITPGPSVSLAVDLVAVAGDNSDAVQKALGPYATILIYPTARASAG